MLDYKGCKIMEVNVVQSIVVEVSQNVLDYKESWFMEMSDYAVSTVQWNLHNLTSSGNKKHVGLQRM